MPIGLQAKKEQPTGCASGDPDASCNQEVAHEGIDDDRIEKNIVLRAPRSRVWRALTDAQEFGTWFRVNLDGRFAVGSASPARSRTQATST